MIILLTYIMYGYWFVITHYYYLKLTNNCLFGSFKNYLPRFHYEKQTDYLR